MLTTKISSQLMFPIALALLGCNAIALAQTTEVEVPVSEEEALEEISPDESADEDVTQAEDDGLSELVFDEQTQSYRLVEDKEGDDWVEQPSDRENQADELQRLFGLYREALTNRDFLEADTLAKRVVELSIQLNGLDSHDSAKAITNLGIAQHNNKEYEAALRNFMAENPGM